MKGVFMKSIASSLYIIGICFFSYANTNTISVNPVQLFLFSMYNLEFEGALSDNSTFSVFLGITGNAFPDFMKVEQNMREQRLGYKFYPQRKAPSGFYVGPNISLTTGSLYSSEYTISKISALGLSAETGYRWMLGKFGIAPFGGFGWTITHDLFGQKVEYTTGEGEIKLLPIFWYYGLKIGWAW